MPPGTGLSPVLPSENYAHHLKEREDQVRHCETLHVRTGNIRLLIAVIAAAIVWLSILRRAFSPWWLLVPVVAFAIAVLYHSQVLRKRSCALRAVTFYKNGLARIEDRWAGTGQTGERFEAPHHVYAADLDLFGNGSLFELLSTARTRMGQDRLAKWLLSPSSNKQIQERHAAIRELRDKLEFREDLYILGEDLGVGVHPEPLSEWAEAPNPLDQHWRWLAPLFVVLAIGSAVLWAIRGIAAFFVLVVIFEGLVTYLFRKELSELFSATERAFEDLDLLSALLRRLESESFEAPSLQALKQELTSHHLEGSQAIARLRTIVHFIESRHHQIVRVLDVPLMYSVQVAVAAEAWRKAHGHAVRSWLNVAGEIEALLSLATYSYEHPADPFPEFVEGPTAFQGDELGHPLIPANKCVRNSVHIYGKTRVLLVSGSNMSGKSTLLRTVGINTVLAMAGAPVRAQRLQLAPLQVGASIRINDSLHEGNSRFYAEITRLRQVYELGKHASSLLFLLDELLQGTNSKDRRIGAEGVVRALVEQGAIGLISTHDLALTTIVGVEDGTLQNVHFQDDLESGTMKFDFKLRDGVVTKSNALELMRSIGLKV